MKLINDTLLFQHVYSQSEHSRLVALTSKRTILYCLKHNIDYHLVVGEYGERPEIGHWAAIFMLRDALKDGYKNVIYLDADTIICDMETDLREACVDDKIGAVWHNSIPEGVDLSHFNAGALYVRNGEKTRAFIDEWISKAPGNPWSSFPLVGDQGILNVLGKERGIINPLDNKWNAEQGLCPSDHPVVLGFHGFKDLLGCMSITMKDLE